MFMTITAIKDLLTRNQYSFISDFTQKYLYILLSIFLFFFFAYFCLHDNWRTPAPIVFKFMSVIKDGHDKIPVIIQQELKHLMEGDCLSNMERHNEWLLYAGIYTTPFRSIMQITFVLSIFQHNILCASLVNLIIILS